MKEVFEIAEKLENKLLEFQEPTCIRDFILYTATGVRDEERDAPIQTILESISGIYKEWDIVLLKLLGSNISNTEKTKSFVQLESKIKAFEERNNINSISKAINNTPFGSSVLMTYKVESAKYRQTLKGLIIDYKNVFLKYYNSFAIPISKKEFNSKNTVIEKVTIPHRIGWHNSVTNFDEFFEDLILNGSISLANGKKDKKQIFKVLREIFDVYTIETKKVKIKNSQQQLTHRLSWNYKLATFGETFGVLFNSSGKTTLFLDFSKRGDITPIGRVFYLAFLITKKVKEEQTPIQEDALLSCLRRNSVKKEKK